MVQPDSVARSNAVGRAALALAVAAVAGCPAAAPPPEAPAPDPGPARALGGVVVSHEHSALSPKIGDWFAGSGVLQAAADLVNHAVTLDTTVKLVAADCGRANAYYDPHTRTVTLCHELVAVIAGTFADDQRYLRQLYLFVALHELGHAVIDVLDLPVVGREEDAADQFAALYFVNPSAHDVGLVMGVVLAAQFFRRADADQAVFWDNHSFGEARYYQMLCLVYGGSPAAREPLTKVLPAERADSCIGEYRQIRHGWNRLLEPYRGDRGDTFAE